MKIPEPWPHQKATVDFFRDRPRGNDFGDPGIGKTRAQLDIYAARKNPDRLLIVCPKTLMYSAWAADIEQFTPQITYALAYANNREAAFSAGTDAVIINTDGVKWLADNPKILKQFDHLVIDESTAFKHASSARSKAMKKIKKHFKHRYGITGTPNPISVTELWHQMLIIDDGERLGTSFYRFRSAVQTPTQVGPSANHLRWDDKPGMAEAVDELIADITIRFAFDEVMTHVPATHTSIRRFQLNDKTRAHYERMKQDAILQLESGEITAVHAAALRTKLLQIASGAVYTGNDEYSVLDTQRYELVADLVEERDHSVVFFNWRHQRDQLCKLFNKRHYSFAVIDGSTHVLERDEIVKRYQAGEYKTLALHPKTGAHGLTLTRADTTIFSSPIYEADIAKQAMHRIYRGSQDKATNSIWICAEDTVDEAVMERRMEKGARMDELLSLLQYRRSTK